MSDSESSSLKVFPAAEEHLAGISDLAAIIWRAHYPGIITPAQIDYMLARMYDLSVLREELTNGIQFERAIVDGEFRGFSSFGPASLASEIKLHKLYVHPDWQGHGIGRALLNSCERQAKECRATALVLNVNKRNERAMAAYGKYGFAIRESVTLDIGGGFVMDDYVMAKPL